MLKTFKRNKLKDQDPKISRHIERVRILETVIAGVPERGVISEATRAWFDSYLPFLFPETMKKNRKLKAFCAMEPVVRARIESVKEFSDDIVAEINTRVQLLNDPDSPYQELVAREKRQWVGDDYDIDEVNVPYGELLCSDQGIPAEATAGENEAQGRILGGDGLITFNEDLNQFQLEPSPFGKKMTHQGRLGKFHKLEPIIEHTGCGRRMQLVDNIDSDNEISDLVRLVMDNLGALHSEFSGDEQKVSRAIETISSIWKQDNTHMISDRGRWVGIIIKMAQRQAYKQQADTNFIMPIELYEKETGDLLTGFDSIEALTHPAVIERGGFTPTAINILINEGIVFSTRESIAQIDQVGQINLEAELVVGKGSRTYDQLQHNWLEVKTNFVTVTENLWRMYRDNDPRYDQVRGMVNSFLNLSLQNCSQELSLVDSKQQGVLSSQLVKQRLTHQLFHSIAYSYTLDTYELGNPPGVVHLEDHMAIGESSNLGAKGHLALGLGDIRPPTADEIITQRLVMLSINERVNEPLVLFLKSDTNSPADGEMSGEETGSIIQNMKTLLELWPYLLLGDIVPIIAVRGKENNGAIARIGVSVLKEMKDIVTLLYCKGFLPEEVIATNSLGDIVKIKAAAILNLGLQTGNDLLTFRKSLTKLADSNSNVGTINGASH